MQRFDMGAQDSVGIGRRNGAGLRVYFRLAKQAVLAGKPQLLAQELRNRLTAAVQEATAGDKMAN